MTEKSKNYNQNQSHPHSIPNILQEMRQYHEPLRRKEKIKSPHKLLELFGQITDILNGPLPNHEDLGQLRIKDQKINELEQDLEQLNEQFSVSLNRIENLESNLERKNQEINRLNMVNKGLDEKFQELINDTEDIKESNRIFKEKIKVEQKVENKIDRLLEKEEKKKRDPKLEVEFEANGEAFHEIRELLENCNCAKCKDVHNIVIHKLDFLQRNFINLNYALISAESERDLFLLRGGRFLIKVNGLKHLVQKTNQALLKGKESEQFEVLRTNFEALNAKFYDSEYYTDTVDKITGMAEIFEIQIKDLKSKAEILLKNIHFSCKYTRVIKHWMQCLEDFVGKSTGEVAQIWALLSPKKI